MFACLILQKNIVFIGDKNRVLLSGENPDYIHAVSANVSNCYAYFIIL